MLRFALNSIESVDHQYVYIYIYYLIGHAKLLLWFLRHFFEERLRRDNTTRARWPEGLIVQKGSKKSELVQI